MILILIFRRMWRWLRANDGAPSSCFPRAMILHSWIELVPSANPTQPHLLTSPNYMVIHTMQIIKENCINNKRKQKFESIFFQKIPDIKNGKKEIGVKVRKQNFQEHILDKKIGTKICRRQKSRNKLNSQNFVKK